MTQKVVLPAGSHLLLQNSPPTTRSAPHSALCGTATRGGPLGREGGGKGLSSAQLDLVVLNALSRTFLWAALLLLLFYRFYKSKEETNSLL